MSERIAFQGEPGANSHLAAHAAFPEMTPLPCLTFEDAFAAVREGHARYAMIPIENSLAGRVADVHHLIPESGLFIIGERFEPIRHQLMAVKGAKGASRMVRSAVPFSHFNMVLTLGCPAPADEAAFAAIEHFHGAQAGRSALDRAQRPHRAG